MGEIADMMLDGTLCAGCGVAMDDLCDGFEAPGFPRYCSRACEPAGHSAPTRRRGVPPSNEPSFMKTNCPTCGKRVKKAGLEHHIRDVHGK